MPAILGRIASDRTQPYEHFETHDLIDASWRTHDGVQTSPVGETAKGYGYISKVGVRKYCYVTPRYALGSLYDGKQGDVTFWAAMRRWALDWDSERPSSTLFFTHYFPDANNGNRDAYYEWRSSSPFEQVMQHRDTLIALYNIPEEGEYVNPYSHARIPIDKHPFIDGFISSEAMLRIENGPNGWVFCHGGSVLVAVRTLQPSRWVDEHVVHFGQGERCQFERRLRSEGRRNGVILETADPGEFTREGDAGLCDEERIAIELQRFSTLILEKANIEFDTLDEALTVSYANRHGDRLQFTYDGERKINGNAVDFRDWPLIANPFMASVLNSGMLKLTYGDERLLLDYTRWRCEESCGE
jgi:hypothetical protein